MAACRGEKRVLRRAPMLAAATAIVALVATPALAAGAVERIGASKSQALGGAVSRLEAGASKKKRKKRAPAVTSSAQVAFGSGTTQAATASCARRTHMTGGGFDVAPPFTPPGAGLRSVNSTSHPTDASGWHASGTAFSSPVAAGSFTAHVRCESNKLGKLAGIISSTTVLPPGIAQTFTFNCPPGTHALSGGYAGPGAAGFEYLPGGRPSNLRIIPLQSRRTGPDQWTVQALNSNLAPSATSLTGYAVCERDARGRKVGEASAFSALINDGRVSGNPSCAGRKQHVVSGGFLISPNTIGTVPGTAIDEFRPVGKGTWRLGLHDLVNVDPPPGSSVQTFAYCARDKPPRKKAKRS